MWLQFLCFHVFWLLAGLLCCCFLYLLPQFSCDWVLQQFWTVLWMWGHQTVADQRPVLTDYVAFCCEVNHWYRYSESNPNILGWCSSFFFYFTCVYFSPMKNICVFFFILNTYNQVRIFCSWGRGCFSSLIPLFLFFSCSDIICLSAVLS